MAKLRINGDSSGYVDLEAPNAASSSTIDLDQVPQKNVANTFTETQQITNTANGAYYKINAPTSGDISSGYLVYQGSTIRGGFYTNPTHGMTHVSDNYHTFRNNNANRMIIDSSGRVTTPYQPGFHVSNTTTPSGSSFTDGHNTVLKFDYVNSNVGSGWNTSTYRYTAPISGRYMIYGQARFDGITTYARVYVSVNGNNGWWTPGLHVISTQHPPSGGELWSGTVQGILPLSAGDYIELKGGGNNSVGTHQGEGSFGAYLLG